MAFLLSPLPDTLLPDFLPTANGGSFSDCRHGHLRIDKHCNEVIIFSSQARPLAWPLLGT